MSKFKKYILDNPVSGHNLETIRGVNQKIISSQDFAERDYDYYNDEIEFRWACSQLDIGHYES